MAMTVTHCSSMSEVCIRMSLRSGPSSDGVNCTQTVFEEPAGTEWTRFSRTKSGSGELIPRM